MEFEDIFDAIHGTYESRLLKDGHEVSKCRVCAYDDGTWSVSQWYTAGGYKRSGYGREVMRHVLEAVLGDRGAPLGVRYVWNGANAYVVEWLKRHFSPVSLLPIEEQKYGSSDDWRAHVYELDVGAFLSYFEIGELLEDLSDSALL